MIGTLINEQSDEMRKIGREMEEREREIMQSSVEGRKLLMKMRIKYLDDEMKMRIKYLDDEMKMRIKYLDDEMSKIDHENTRLDEELVCVNRKIKEVKSAKVTLKGSSENLNEETWNKRCQLIDQIETLKKEKSIFRSDCRDKKKRLEEQIDRLRIDLGNKESEPKDGAGEKMEKLKRTLSSEEARLKETQLNLGTICKNISRLQRRLDDIPSRSELNQYQRRFVELYDQSKCRHLFLFNYLLTSSLFHSLYSCNENIFFKYLLTSSLFHSLYSCNETYRNKEILHSLQST